MPIHDLGYRAWEGRRTAEPLRAWVITQTGVVLAWKNYWLRRLLFVTWIPALYMGAAFFGYEQWLSQGELRELATGMIPGMPPSMERHEIWTWLLMTFFRYPQGLLMLLLIGLVAPPLIAQDVRSRAFLLYFSRPLTRLEYLAGKLAIVWAFVLMITTVPALGLYLFAVLLSPDLSVVGQTWDLPLRIVTASAVVVLPTSTLALAFSSLTSETRYAGFAWFAVWIVGWAVYLFLLGTSGQTISDYWLLVSLYHTLGEVQSWVFGAGNTSAALLPAVAMLAAITIVSTAVLYRRISSPMRI